MKIIRVKTDQKICMPFDHDGGWCIKKPKKDGYLVKLSSAESASGAVFVSDEDLKAAEENLNH